MSETNYSLDEAKQPVKLYSEKSITTATFIGGAPAGFYLLSENYKALGKADAQRNSIVIGIAFTAIIILSAFLLPDSIPEIVFRVGIPGLTVLSIWLTLRKTQGAVLDEYQNSKGPFHSGWRVAGITALSALITAGAIFGFAFSGQDMELLTAYDEKMAEFSENEEASFKFYDELSYAPEFKLIQELDNVSIPSWEKNIELLKEVKSWEGLDRELQEQNDILMEYSQLRLQTFHVFKKALVEQGNTYDTQLEELHLEIENVLNKL